MNKEKIKQGAELQLKKMARKEMNSGENED